jgi:hypothetical protein
MKKALPLLIVLLFPMCVWAQQDYPRDITLSWTNASQYEDGTLIEAGDLTGVRIECFRQNESVATFNGTFPALAEGAAQSETITGAIPQPGTYTCYGYSVIFDGTESVASNPATKKYTGKPNPPTTFTYN